MLTVYHEIDPSIAQQEVVRKLMEAMVKPHRHLIPPDISDSFKKKCEAKAKAGGDIGKETLLREYVHLMECIKENGLKVEVFKPEDIEAVSAATRKVFELHNAWRHRMQKKWPDQKEKEDINLW